MLRLSWTAPGSEGRAIDQLGEAPQGQGM